jgi:hypothetical protein
MFGPSHVAYAVPSPLPDAIRFCLSRSGQMRNEQGWNHDSTLVPTRDRACFCVFRSPSFPLRQGGGLGAAAPRPRIVASELRGRLRRNWVGGALYIFRESSPFGHALNLKTRFHEAGVWEGGALCWSNCCFRALGGGGVLEAAS